MTRGDKIVHSPHTSPRLSRKPLPNIPSSTSSSSSSSNRSNTPPQVTPSTSNANAIPKSSKAPAAHPQAGTSSGSSGSGSASYSGNKSALGASSDIPVENQPPPLNRNHARVVENAPPLPPRKSTNQPSKASASLIDVPSKSPPKSPVHHNRYPDLLTGDSLDQIEEDGEPIVGPAETITGVIDTRPLEQRNLTTFASLSQTSSNSINLITINDTEKEEKPLQSQPELSKNSNTYLMNNNLQNNNHQRPPNPNPKALANTQVDPQPIKSKSLESANPSLPHKEKNNRESDRETVQLYENVTKKSSSQSSSCNNSLRLAREAQDNLNPSTMMTISNNNSINLNNVNNNTASYENINLEYINRLMNEGYSKENVVKALGISRNNMEMACHILHEFVDKSSSKATPNNSKVQIKANKGEMH